MKNNFDEKAAVWDDNPRRIKLVENVWGILAPQLEKQKYFKVLDYGCGTGLLGYKFVDTGKDVLFCDNSEGMLNQVRLKAEQQHNENISVLKADFVTDSTPNEKFDLITAMLVLHHVEKLDFLMDRMANLLDEKGLFCWIDIETEDGSFHDDNNGIFHFGFSKEQVNELFNKNGMQLNYFNTNLAIEKEKEDGFRKYPIFIAIGQKT